MEKEQRDPARLSVILLLIGRIRTRLAKTSLESFADDWDDIDLLSYRLSMIGEESNKLTDALKARHPDIPWQQIYGMRNIIAHEYMRVSPLRIWQTATSQLDTLEHVCRTELARLEP
ncbi:HepT-like ribonuclease domain-containing protein [Sphingobium subterraneum]|nr:HepT-like ribonuclease domain-containing protein [Sphingobium subterraneum]